jgi:putative hemolysin
VTPSFLAQRGYEFTIERHSAGDSLLRCQAPDTAGCPASGLWR